MFFIINWVGTALALWVAASVVSGIEITGSWTTYLWVAIVFGLINATLGLLLKIITFPFSIITFGLFLVVINSAMLGLTASLLSSMSIDNFWSALLGSVIVSLVSGIINSVFRSQVKN